MWDKKSNVKAGVYTFLFGKGNEKHQMEQDFVHQRIVSAVKIVQSVSDRMSYTELRSRWCNIIFF